MAGRMDCRAGGVRRSDSNTASAPREPTHAGDEADENPRHKCGRNPQADDAYSSGETPDQIPASHKECGQEHGSHKGKTHGHQRTKSAAQVLELNAAGESPEKPKPIHLRPQEEQQERNSNGEPQNTEYVQMGYLDAFILSSGVRKAGAEG
jgi:hypothetical protein